MGLVSRRFALAATLGVTLSGALQAQRTTVRDSAGVKIVAASEPMLRALPVWRVDDVILAIGDGDERTDYAFNRASRPLRLSDGKVVVVNERVALRLYDGTGTFLAELSRLGSGPGEYRSIMDVFRSDGDTLRVFDPVLRRLDVRGPDGAVVRSDPGVLRAGQWNGSGVGLDLAIELVAADANVGIVERRSFLRRISRTGQPQDTLAVLPGGRINHLGGGTWRGVNLSGGTMFVAGREYFAFVHGDSLVARWFDATGTLRTIARVDVPRRRVTQAAISRFDDRMARLAANSTVIGREGGPQRPDVYAEFLPQVSRIRLDANDNLWVCRADQFGEPSREWIVFARTGHAIARVRMPERFIPSDIGDNYVLGMATDEDDVQSVRMYAIRR